jgi:hypothetical protein
MAGGISGMANGNGSIGMKYGERPKKRRRGEISHRRN